jgi:hypothetical protein
MLHILELKDLPTGGLSAHNKLCMSMQSRSKLVVCSGGRCRSEWHLPGSLYWCNVLRHLGIGLIRRKQSRRLLHAAEVKEQLHLNGQSEMDLVADWSDESQTIGKRNWTAYSPHNPASDTRQSTHTCLKITSHFKFTKKL